MRFYTIRQPVGQAAKDTAFQNKLILSFYGSFTSGTADGDTNLFDQLYITELTPCPEGRQMIPYYLSGRDQGFVFQHLTAPQNRNFRFIEAAFNTSDFDLQSWDDVMVDVDLTRWGYSTTVLSLERTPAQMKLFEFQLRALGIAPVRKDVKLCLPTGNDELAEAINTVFVPSVLL